MAVAVGAATVTPLRMPLGGHNRQHPVVVSSVSSLPHAAREKIDAALPTATTTTIDGLGLCSPRSRREGAVDEGEGAEMMAIARVAVETGGVGVVGGAVDVPSMEGGGGGRGGDKLSSGGEGGEGRAGGGGERGNSGGGESAEAGGEGRREGRLSLFLQPLAGSCCLPGCGKVRLEVRRNLLPGGGRQPSSICTIYDLAQLRQ